MTAKVGGAALAASALAASVLLLTGYGSDPPSQHGDCNARIRFHGTVFRSHNLVNEAASVKDDVTGTGEVVGCDLDVVDHVAVHKVQGVDPRLAIAVVGEQWPGVYVREGTKPGDWPTQLMMRTS